MSPRTGRPLSEEPKDTRFSIRLGVNLDQQLENYCKKHNRTKGDVIRDSLSLFLVNEHEKECYTDDEKRLREEAEKQSLTISKGYQKINGQYVRDENGNRIVGYMIADNQNNIMDGATETERFSMNLEEVNVYMTTQQENYVESEVLKYREYLDEKSLEWIEDSVRDELEIEEQKVEERLDELVSNEDKDALFGAARTSYIKKFLKDKEKELFNEYKEKADEENEKKAEEYRRKLIKECTE